MRLICAANVRQFVGDVAGPRIVMARLDYNLQLRGEPDSSHNFNIVAGTMGSDRDTVAL